jgi:hypothetical protein
MKIVNLRSTTTRPADATAYAAGDEVSNHATAGSVVRATFNMAAFKSGSIIYAGLDITPASSNVVTTAADFELLIFRTADVPAAVGDNVTSPITAAQRAAAIACFRFDDTAWTGPLGTVAAGTSQHQMVGAHLVQPLATPVLQYPHTPGFFFNFEGLATYQFTAVLRALAAWTPLAVINTIGITLAIGVE